MMTIARRRLLSHQQLRALSSCPTPSSFGISKLSEFSRLWKIRKSLSAQFSVGDRITVHDRNSDEILIQGVVKYMGLRTTSVTPRDGFLEKVFLNKTFGNNNRESPDSFTPASPALSANYITVLSHLIEATWEMMDAMEHLRDGLKDAIKKTEDATEEEEKKVAISRLIDTVKEMRDSMVHLIDAKEKIIDTVDGMEKTGKEEEEWRETRKGDEGNDRHTEGNDRRNERRTRRKPKTCVKQEDEENVANMKN